MLKLEVAIPPPPSMDFDFNDARPMPFLSAPSTPKRFGDYSFSVSSSRTPMADASFHDFDRDSRVGTRPDTLRSAGGDDFAFDFRSELEQSAVSAEELFEGGKIKPLMKPQNSPLLSPIARGKKVIRQVFSPRKKTESESELEPFTTPSERGREKAKAPTNNPSRRAARSLSPHRVSEYPWEENNKQQSTAAQNSKTSNTQLLDSSSSLNKSSSKKWRLKDLFLFRSASEGRASGKEYKYSVFDLFRKPVEDAKSSSFRSSDSSSSVSKTRRKGQVLSAHELHYKANKAASQDLKKRTYLPYKQGILGR